MLDGTANVDGLVIGCFVTFAIGLIGGNLMIVGLPVGAGFRVGNRVVSK